MKPRLFIGSSSESLYLANALHANLDNDALVTVWDQGIFELSKVTLESLIDALDKFDAAVFIFSPDDTARLKGKEVVTVRDNVIFEFGLFLGRLGRESTFFVMPKNTPDMHLPTDFLGITAATYDANRADGNHQAALAVACEKIRKKLRLQRDNPYLRLEFPRNDLTAITDFMCDWIKDQGRVAVFSCDMSWARDNPEIRMLLTKKAAANELVVFLPQRLEWLDEIPQIETYCYPEINYIPESRFTFMDFGRPGGRVAIGCPRGKFHVVEVFNATDHPVLHMARDLLNIIMKRQSKN